MKDTLIVVITLATGVCRLWRGLQQGEAMGIKPAVMTPVYSCGQVKRFDVVRYHRMPWLLRGTIQRGWLVIAGALALAAILCKVL